MTQLYKLSDRHWILLKKSKMEQVKRKRKQQITKAVCCRVAKSEHATPATSPRVSSWAEASGERVSHTHCTRP
jgi:hypothetical protein